MPYTSKDNKVYYKAKDGIEYLTASFSSYSYNNGNDRARDYAEWSNKVSSLVEFEKGLAEGALKTISRK